VTLEPKDQGQVPVDEAVRRRASQRRRSIMLALALAAAAVLFYVLTIAKLGPALFNRPL
jgi:hypothetical protein